MWRFFQGFFFGCAGSLLLHTGFLQLRQAGATLVPWGYSRAGASHCISFFCCGSQALKQRLSSCGAEAQLPCGSWDLPGPGVEPVSPCIGRWILNHWTTREVPFVFNITCIVNLEHIQWFQSLDIYVSLILWPRLQSIFICAPSILSKKK